MTEVIKVEVDEALARRFRRRASEKFGYKKGTLKRAVEDAMRKYTSPVQADWASVKGGLRSEWKDRTSVSLQHSAWISEK
ncbi:MAG: hypothetical protein HY297_06230 [Thaumarchaeota archaeon]|nr:hypothetical protein [Nitrososphaerota archaeon]